MVGSFDENLRDPSRFRSNWLITWAGCPSAKLLEVGYRVCLGDGEFIGVWVMPHASSPNTVPFRAEAREFPVRPWPLLCLPRRRSLMT